MTAKNGIIKIPGTAEGVQVIRHCIIKGINIHATLLSGMLGYRSITNVYMSDLEDRVNFNQPVNEIASVASIFLSRFDGFIILSHEGMRKLAPGIFNKLWA